MICKFLIVLRIFFNHFFKKGEKHGTELALQNLCQPNDLISKFLQLIPSDIDQELKKSNSDFTRKRALPFPKLIAFILSLVTSGKSSGVDSKSGEFFKNARRSGLWPEADPVHRSAVTKARKKVSWEVFRDLLSKVVTLAYEIWPSNPIFLWHGMSVFAVDGSKFNLPATDEIRKEFDPKSGLDKKGKGHFPQGLVSTVFDVFRRIPVGRTVMNINASERDEAQKLLPFLPQWCVWLFDRGYPAFGLIKFLVENLVGYFIFRCPASSTFPAVEAFIKSGKKEKIIWVTPTNKYLSHIPAKDKKNCKSIKLRAIRLVSPDGILSVLLTNLYDKKQFTIKEINALYFRRWEIEGYYRDEKVVMELEKFHSKTVNGIRQELFASMIMTVITRTLMVMTSEMFYSGEKEVQFKNALRTMAAEAAVLVPEDPEKAVEIFNDILTEMSRVIYYRPKIKRPSQPRVTKTPINKWSESKTKRFAQNA